MYKELDGVQISPILLGDSAFTHHTWLQKPYSHAVLSEEQSYFNYRLSRARMVVESAYGRAPRARARASERARARERENIKI